MLRVIIARNTGNLRAALGGAKLDKLTKRFWEEQAQKPPYVLSENAKNFVKLEQAVKDGTAEVRTTKLTPSQGEAVNRLLMRPESA